MSLERAYTCGALVCLTILFALLRRWKSGCMEGGQTVMSQRISPGFKVRRALLRSLASRYWQASPAQKTLLLDSFVDWTGYSRKYAIALLNHGEHTQQTIQRRRLYIPATLAMPVAFAGNGWLHTPLRFILLPALRARTFR